MRHPDIISYPYWRNLVNDRRRMSWNLAKKLSERWDVTPQQLMDIDGKTLEQIFLKRDPIVNLEVK